MARPKWDWVAIGAIETLLLTIGFIYFVPLTEDSRGQICIVNGVDSCFCERIHENGFVMQPINTYSCYAFVISGLIICRLVTSSLRTDATNRMTKKPVLAALYGLLAIWIGPASMLLHATYTSLGGKLDVISMIMWITFIIVYNLVRLLRLSGIPERIFSLFMWLGIVGISVLVEELHRYPDWIFGTLVIAAAVLEFAIFAVGRHLYSWRNYLHLAGGIFTFLVAFTIWNLFKTSGRYCNPNSWFQGHAVWHIGSSLSILLVYLHFRQHPDPAYPCEVCDGHSSSRPVHLFSA